jgi:DNA-binding transcriptional regulator YiaG
MSGLDNVYLVNGYKVHDTEYGEAVSISNVDGLHKVISRALLCKDGRLSPREFRFLRVEMNSSQVVIARMLGVDEQTVARIERGETTPSVPYEISFRALAVEVLFAERSEIKAIIDKISRRLDDEYKQAKLTLKETGRTWKLAA